MKDFGAALRDARIKAGISLDEIHEATRISMKHLQAIEAGDFPSVPQTYVRAFIREYAGNVGLDEDSTVSLYNDFAERERGIPKPPEATDQSRILPKLDDTIEIIAPSRPAPKHVEVEGAAEIPEQESFTPPVRVSPAAAQISSPALDISTARKAEAAPVPESVIPVPGSTFSHEGASPSAAPPPEQAGDASSPSAQAPHDETAEAGRAPASRRSEIIEKLTLQSDPRKESSIPESIRKRPSVYDMKPPIPGEEPSAAARASATRTATTTTRKKEKPSGKEPISAEERRYLIIAVIMVGIVAIGIFSIINLQSEEEEPLVAVDSTGLKSTLESGAFMDSTQETFIELSQPPPDTARRTPPPVEEQITQQAHVSAREDSLVLEAISYGPVWFSIRMDTTRTERGRLSSNDHRVWKARDRFTITLGDGGAVTFFLNGKELGPLGENGAVVRNLPISRQNLGGSD